jgi:hypothetical protein
MIILIYDILRHGCWKRTELNHILVIYCVSVENEATTYYIIDIDIRISPFPCYIRGLLRTKQQHISYYIYWCKRRSIVLLTWILFFHWIQWTGIVFQWTGYFVHWIQWTGKILQSVNYIMVKTRNRLSGWCIVPIGNYLHMVSYSVDA